MNRNYATLILSAIALATLASCREAATVEKSYNQGINVIPAPQHLVVNEGAFTLNRKTTLYASTPDAQTVAAFFAAKLQTATGYPFELTGSQGSHNTIALLTDASLDVNDEGYTLDVTPDGALVKAKTPQGLFYGMQTFMQLLPAEIESPEVVKDVAWKAPAATIRDQPRFGYRGAMLDACRHFMPASFVKKQLDVLALFKINRMHWHLTDDQGWRIEIGQYPQLTEIGSKSTHSEGFYTQDEVKEIVQYAAERFITIVPEIELPGHELAAIAAYPELSCTGQPTTPRLVWGVEDVVLCAGKESVFAFFENVIREVAALFPSEYFHIGGDECPKSSWKTCPRCQARIRELGLKADAHHTAEERLQSYFIQRIEKMLAACNKRMIGWDEILEGGLAPTATVMSWRGEAGGIAAALERHDAIMTPGSAGMYIDHYQGDAKIEPVSIGGYTTLEKTYAYNPVPDTLAELGLSHHIRGVQCNLWTEYLYTTELMEYRLYPRVIALAEIAWTPTEGKDYKDFERRILNACVRLDGHGINYHIPQPEQTDGSCNTVAFTDRVSLTFGTTRPVDMVYTTDGSEPTPQSAPYVSPIAFARSGVLQIRSVLPSGKMSRTRVITVDKQTLSPAAGPETRRPGLLLQLAEGEYLDVDGLEGVQTWRDSTLTDLGSLSQLRPYSASMRHFPQYAAIATGYVDIPEDGVYFISGNLEEIWIDDVKLVDNRGEVKRYSRHDSSVALAKGLHRFKAVFLGHILGGWPSNWTRGNVMLRKADADRFTPISPEQLYH